MKKIFAILLTMSLLLTGIAVAEETAETVTAPENVEIDFATGEEIVEDIPMVNDEAVVEAVAEQDIIDFEITMDKIPEGYVMTNDKVEGIVYAVFTPEDEKLPSYIMSVGYAPAFDGYTMTNLSAEELLEAQKTLLVDYNEAEVEILTTEYGTQVFHITETEADSSYSELFTVYEGYMIDLTYYGMEELTDEDLIRGRQIMSDMWIKK